MFQTLIKITQASQQLRKQAMFAETKWGFGETGHSSKGHEPECLMPGVESWPLGSVPAIFP